MSWSTDLKLALEQLPAGRFLMASAYEDDRAGLIVRSVQPCSSEPPLLCVAVRTGHRIEPLIRDSRCFALSRVGEEDRLVRHKFSATPAPDSPDGADPFAAIAIETLTTGSPVLRGSPLVFDCEVVRHFDLEADCELYIGQVISSRVLRGVA